VERDRAKGQSADAAWGSRVLGVELRCLLWGVVEILPVFPGISLYPVAFPFDQVLEFPSGLLFRIFSTMYSSSPSTSSSSSGGF